MKFEFIGFQFRIRFRHDRDRSPWAHIGHTIILERHSKFGLVAMCVGCNLVIGGPHGLSKAMAERKTHCLIEYLAGDEWVVVFQGVGNPNEDEGDRFTKSVGRTHSLANALTRENWFASRLGPSGCYERVDREWPSGLSVLSNLRATFKQAAWEAFNTRGKGK